MFKRILVPLDGSPLAEQALPHARALAGKFAAHLILLRITNKEKDSPAAQDRLQYLQKLAEELSLEGVSSECRLEQGEPARVIVEHAESEEVDLVVMSSHGCSGISRWIYGSVAERVLGNACCPLFLVRSA